MAEIFWFKARFSWGRCFSLLNDQEISSLVRAIWKLAETGEDSQLIGKAAFIWPMICSEIAQDSIDRENGRKGGRPQKQENPGLIPGINPPLEKHSTTIQSISDHSISKQSTLLPADGPSAPAVTKHRKPKTDSPGFDEFWASYPKHQGKAAAKKAWNAIAPDDDLLQRILSAIEGQKRDNPSWKDSGGRFIPLPSTWLNGSRWDDEMQTEKSSSSKFSDIGVTL